MCLRTSRPSCAPLYGLVEAGIPEYWIVNPLADTITVIALDGASYVAYGVFCRGDRAVTKLLDGFSVMVDEVLNAK